MSEEKPNLQAFFSPTRTTRRGSGNAALDRIYGKQGTDLKGDRPKGPSDAGGKGKHTRESPSHRGRNR